MFFEFLTSMLTSMLIKRLYMTCSRTKNNSQQKNENVYSKIKKTYCYQSTTKFVVDLIVQRVVFSIAIRRRYLTFVNEYRFVFSKRKTAEVRTRV